MAQHGDVENQSTVNEQTPLIENHEPGHDEDQNDDVREEEQKPRLATWYIWRTFWFLIAALILALFIKGWIDAGSDVNVSFNLMIDFILLTTVHSLTSKLLSKELLEGVSVVLLLWFCRCYF